METLIIKKIYKEEEYKVKEIRLSGKKPMEFEVDKKRDVLQNGRGSAFLLAETTAQKKRYASVSLLREDSQSYTFQLYGRKQKKIKKVLRKF